jgi:hypothetical protein
MYFWGKTTTVLLGCSFPSKNHAKDCRGLLLESAFLETFGHVARQNGAFLLEPKLRTNKTWWISYQVLAQKGMVWLPPGKFKGNGIIWIVMYTT